jgi:6-pyruvoyltetrahydropterin/6-carboxytetrahydropterin synthase
MVFTQNIDLYRYNLFKIVAQLVVEVMPVGNLKPGSTGLSIFVEGSFDYAHFLPSNERCFPLHGHTSTAKLELKGEADKSGMVMDFSDAKALLNEALSEVDHKLVASRAHAVREGGTLVVEYKKFLFRLPAEHVFLLYGEGTSENISLRLAELIMAKAPPNISWMRLTITEGLRKGSSVVLERHT